MLFIVWQSNYLWYQKKLFLDYYTSEVHLFNINLAHGRTLIFVSIIQLWKLIFDSLIYLWFQLVWSIKSLVYFKTVFLNRCV